MSLLQFDPNCRTLITTPRSKRALQSLGLTENDLYYVNRQEILTSGLQNDLKEDADCYLDLKERHVKERADNFLKMALLERDKQEQQPDRNTSSINASQMSTTFLAKQDHIMKMLQNKQQIEIEREIQHEVRLDQLKKKNEQKEEKLMELKLQQQLNFQQKMQEKEEKLQVRQAKLQQARAQADQHNEQIMQRLHEEEIKIQAKQEKYAKMKQVEKEEREQATQEKMQRRELRIQQQQEQIAKENEQRQQDYNRKLQQMEWQLAEKQHKIKVQNEEQEQKAKLKYENANKLREQMKKQMQYRLNSKERELQLRNQLQEHERRTALEERRVREHKKYQSMQFMKQQIEQFTDQKNQSYFDAEQERTYKKQQLDLRRKEERDEQSLASQSRIEEAQQRCKQQQLQSELEKERMLSHKLQLTQNAEELRQQNLQKIKRKYINELIKLEDAAQNNSIQKRKDDYKNILLTEKLEETDRRHKAYLLEQQRFMETKRQMEVKLEKEKEKVMADFESRKIQYLEEMQHKPTEARTVSQFRQHPTERSSQKPKNKSAISFHLPPPTSQNQADVNKPVTEVRQVPKGTGDKMDSSQNRSTISQKKHYFVSEETLKAVQIYANGATLKQFNIDVRPKNNRKKTSQ